MQKKIKSKTIRSIAGFIALSFIFSNFTIARLTFAQNENDTTEEKEIVYGYTAYRQNRYENYIKSYVTVKKPQHELIIAGSDFISSDGADIEIESNYKGRENVAVWANQEGTLSYNVVIPEDGLYQIALSYYPLEGSRGNPELALKINGDLPFSESAQLSFMRLWRDEQTTFKQDNRGNDIRPIQVTESDWLEVDIKDKDGIINDPYLFYFEEGEHVISLEAIRERFAIDYIKVYNPKPRPVYETFKEENYNKSVNGYFELYQAENASYKSDPSLYPITDRIDPLTTPYSSSKIRLNTIGGYNWRFPGQWIEWEIEVPEDGDYIIGLRYRQDYLRGLNSHRRIYINGKVPFKELSSVAFKYKSSWQQEAFGDQSPYRFHLEKGKNTIRMEVVTGDTGPTIQVIEQAIYDLNLLYRRIIMITGVTPDIYRDYDLAREIPELKNEFARLAKVLDDEMIRIESYIGKISSELGPLRETVVQLKNLAQYPDTIVTRLDRYKSNISSLSATMMTMKEQPLELDYLFVASPDADMPKARGNIFDHLIHVVRSFIASFFVNYDIIGNVSQNEQEPLEVWVGSGRDQAQVVKGMVDSMFTPDKNIDINISLVQGTLMEATMAGKGPDIALNVPRHLPVDLAVRNALLPLSEYEDFDEIKGYFQDTALTPYTIKGKTYALPETQEFNMLFYRIDIFEELGLEPPNTWEELYEIAWVLSRNNMDIGVPSLMPQAPGDMYTPFPRTFGTLLIQRGLGYYNDNMSITSFNDKKAINAFIQYVDFYREFGLPVYYDFANRFRTGEMPIAIAPFTAFNFLYIFAPEIRNLWQMERIPGTVQEDGSINRGQEAYGSASVVFSTVERPKEAYEFLKWWVSEDTQIRFANEMESLMGPAARQPTANIAAFSNLPWSVSELKILEEQRSEVVEQPEIPGSYFVSRNLNNAIIEVVFERNNAMATLEKYNNYINEEINRKRKEFNLD